MKKSDYQCQGVRTRMAVQKSTIRTVLCIVLCMMATGCIPTNYYTSDSRKNVSQKMAELIVPGETTKEDVFLSLGEPDEVSLDETSFTYRWTKVIAIWFVATSGYTGGFVDMERDYNIVIDFDKNGVVSAYEFRKGPLMDEETFDITISIPVATEVMQGDLLADVTLNDLRLPSERNASKRIAAFGTTLGIIRFDPPETQVVRKLLEDELSVLQNERGETSRKFYDCDLLEFRVYTDARLFNWDVVGRIRVTLRQGQHEYDLAGSHTVRTFVRPSEAVIIKEVVEESLRQIAAGLKVIK